MATISLVSSSTVVTSTTATLTDGKVRSLTSSATTVTSAGTWPRKLATAGEIAQIPCFDVPPPTP